MGYLERWRRAAEYWLAERVYSFGARLCVRSAATLVEPIPEEWRAAARDFIGTELHMLPRHAHDFAIDKYTVQQTARAQLARRYDPGAALNRAFDEAAKKIAEGVEAGQLSRSVVYTDKQKAALKVQEETLRRNMQARGRL